jgi:hypothetical protein
LSFSFLRVLYRRTKKENWTPGNSRKVEYKRISNIETLTRTDPSFFIDIIGKKSYYKQQEQINGFNSASTERNLCSIEDFGFRNTAVH